MSAYQIIAVLHILIIAPLLLVISRTDWVPNYVLIIAGALIALYHAYKYTSTGRWIFIVHALLFGPVIAARGLMPASRWPKEVLLMIAFAAVGYHAYYLGESF